MLNCLWWHKWYLKDTAIGSESCPEITHKARKFSCCWLNSRVETSFCSHAYYLLASTFVNTGLDIGSNGPHHPGGSTPLLPGWHLKSTTEISRGCEGRLTSLRPVSFKRAQVKVFVYSLVKTWNNTETPPQCWKTWIGLRNALFFFYKDDKITPFVKHNTQTHTKEYLKTQTQDNM